MHFKTADVAGLRVFYREAGDPSKPTIVLLHGFPSSSHQFHELIPLLADRFHVIAPDYPGMGFSEAPDPTILQPTFDDVAMAIDAFIAQRAPGPLIVYLLDIGGPIGIGRRRRASRGGAAVQQSQWLHDVVIFRSQLSAGIPIIARATYPDFLAPLRIVPTNKSATIV
jgi:Alpha/beta hydrolase family